MVNPAMAILRSQKFASVTREMSSTRVDMAINIQPLTRPTILSIALLSGHMLFHEGTMRYQHHYFLAESGRDGRAALILRITDR